MFGTTILFSCSQEKVNNSNETKVAALDTLIKAKEISIGKKIYEDNCVTCHGTDGKKKLDEAKDLSISVLNLKESIKIISSTQTIGALVHSPRFTVDLSEEDIKEVAQYIITFRK